MARAGDAAHADDAVAPLIGWATVASASLFNFPPGARVTACALHPRLLVS